MKRFKRVLSLALACLFMLSIMGCTPSDGIQKPKKTIDNGEKLTIYYAQDSFDMNRAVSSYNRVAKEECKLEAYEGDADTLATEVLAGKGPDLFLFGRLDFDNLYNYVGKGVFQDLNYYFEQDPVDWNKYNTAITDAGVFGGKRYLLPYSYFMDLYVTTDKTLESCGIPEDIQLIRTEYSDLLSYQESIKAQGMKMFSKAPSNSLMSLAQNYMDYDNKTSHFNSEEFRNAIEKQKELAQISGAVQQATFPNDKYVFTEVPIACMSYVWSEYAGKIPDERELLYSQRDEKNGGYLADVNCCVAINANSANGKRAFEFVKWLMREDTQWDDGIVANPINLDAVDWQLTNVWRDYRSESEDLKQQYMDIIHNITVCKIRDTKFYYSVFSTLWQDYKDDKITLDTFVKELDNKASLYLQEL